MLLLPQGFQGDALYRSCEWRERAFSLRRFTCELAGLTASSSVDCPTGPRWTSTEFASYPGPRSSSSSATGRLALIPPAGSYLLGDSVHGHDHEHTGTYRYHSHSNDLSTWQYIMLSRPVERASRVLTSDNLLDVWVLCDMPWRMNSGRGSWTKTRDQAAYIDFQCMRVPVCWSELSAWWAHARPYDHDSVSVVDTRGLIHVHMLLTPVCRIDVQSSMDQVEAVAAACHLGLREQCTQITASGFRCAEEVRTACSEMLLAGIHSPGMSGETIPQAQPPRSRQLASEQHKWSGFAVVSGHPWSYCCDPQRRSGGSVLQSDVHAQRETRSMLGQPAPSLVSVSPVARGGAERLFEGTSDGGTQFLLQNCFFGAPAWWTKWQQLAALWC